MTIRQVREFDDAYSEPSINEWLSGEKGIRVVKITPFMIMERGVFSRMKYVVEYEYTAG